MKPIKFALILFLFCLSALWLYADFTKIALASGLFPWRGLMTQLFGILTFGAFSLAIILAVRPTWFEKHLGGLDKMYRLHKWIGISVLTLSICHRLWVKAPKWLVEAGWAVRPPKGKRPEQSIEIFHFFQSQREIAEQIGEWAFYVALAMILIALVKRLPYKYFYKIHRWIALLYFPLVWHSVVLMDFNYWASPLGIVMGALMLIGTTAAFTSLFNYIGINHIAVGVIDKIEYLENVSVNAVSVQLKSRWNGHQAGQFAFVTFDNDEGAHPFTISSAWQNDGKLRFLVKALGDYTKTLASTLKHDALVKVEGPYGCFDFNGKMQRQIWISGGVGITPFIARMELLALQPDGRSIDFFHSSKVFRDEEFDRLSELAKTAGVNLHLIISARDGELTSEKIRAKVFDWKSADIWFCGPASFGKAILTSLLAEGLTANQFHQELFEMR